MLRVVPCWKFFAGLPHEQAYDLKHRTAPRRPLSDSCDGRQPGIWKRLLALVGPASVNAQASCGGSQTGCENGGTHWTDGYSDCTQSNCGGQYKNTAVDPESTMGYMYVGTTSCTPSNGVFCPCDNIECSPDTTCTDNQSCTGGQVCLAGQCTSCSADSQCDVGQWCNGGSCQACSGTAGYTCSGGAQPTCQGGTWSGCTNGETACTLPPPQWTWCDTNNGYRIVCGAGGWSCVYGGSPIIIDTRDQGFHLTDPAHGVRFRFFPSKPSVQISWTDPAYSNGFLVLIETGTA